MSRKTSLSASQELQTQVKFILDRKMLVAVLFGLVPALALIYIKYF